MICYLCNQALDDEPHTSNEMTVCGKCIKRFAITREDWHPAFMEELRSVVFGYKTNYRCPQCWESVRFRGIYPRVLFCEATKQLVHKECGNHDSAGRFLMLNEYIQVQGEIAPDAPPKARCKACHSPVDVGDDKRFNNQLIECMNCSIGMCLRCCRDSKIVDGKVVNCADCRADKPEGIISRVYKKITGRS
tara:strand:- start:8175 stop:8747 length:573 start_codon:yes stop_codon:yes gene_type:complete